MCYTIKKVAGHLATKLATANKKNSAASRAFEMNLDLNAIFGSGQQLNVVDEMIGRCT